MGSRLFLNSVFMCVKLELELSDTFLLQEEVSGLSKKFT